MPINNDQPRAFRGIWIPAEIWLDKELPLQAKCLFAEINSLDTENGCFASNEHLAEFLNVSDRQLRRLLETLRKKNLVQLVSFNGRTRRISTTQFCPGRPDKNVRADRTKMSSLYDYIEENKEENKHILSETGQNEAKNGTEKDAGFAEFWSAYPGNCPRKTGKKDCLKFWKTHNLAGKTADVIAALNRSKASDDWQRCNGQYICAPVVWLRKELWLENENAVSRAVNAPNFNSDYENDKRLALREWRLFSSKIKGFVIDGFKPHQSEIERCERIRKQYPELNLPPWNAETQSFTA